MLVLRLYKDYSTYIKKENRVYMQIVTCKLLNSIIYIHYEQNIKKFNL